MNKISAKESAIAFKDLHKVFGETIALDGLTLEVPDGTILGLLGPSGAGKTTAIRAVCGSLKPTSGGVEVFASNAHAHRHALRPLLGYMPQSAALYEDLSASENVQFFALAQQVDHPYLRSRQTLDLVGLADRAQDPVHTFSGGMKQRVSLACALVHEPPVLLLDEPTAGLDPRLRQTFWEHFRSLSNVGTTIIVSTHQLDEASYCDTLAILSQGKLLIAAPPERVLDMGHTKISLRIGGTKVDRDVTDYRSELPRLLAEHGLSKDVRGIDVKRDTLEDVFIRLTEQEGSGDEGNGSRNIEVDRGG